MKKADYSEIASYYDKGRPLSEQNIDLWMRLIADYSKVSAGARALDLGCGTGRFTVPMAYKLGYGVTGVDSSAGMLATAKKKDVASAVKWELVDVENLIYPDCSFDVIFISHLLHHLKSPSAVVKECLRILDDSGVLIIRYGAIEQIRGDVVHHFFPETLAIDEARTSTVQMVEDWLGNAGFSNIVSREIVQQTYDKAVTHLNTTKTKGTSVLSMISERAFQIGIEKMAAYIKKTPDDPWLLIDKLTLTVGYKHD